MIVGNFGLITFSDELVCGGGDGGLGDDGLEAGHGGSTVNAKGAYWAAICHVGMWYLWYLPYHKCTSLSSRNVLVAFASISCNKCINLELAFAAIVVHVTDLTKNLPLTPTLVVDATYGPHATNISIRVSAVEAVAVVEVKRRCQGLLRTGHPL